MKKNKINTKRILLTCSAGIAVLISLGSPALAQDKRLPLDPTVKTGKLPNGFAYYIKHNEEPKKRVVFYLANKVGSILETEDQRGLAHFMEHMSFNGTKHFPKNELVNYLQKSGVRFGADLNAYTGFDETVYQLPLPTDDPAIMKNGIQIMRDWAREATLDPVEINKERGVVLEEKRLGMGAEERIRRQLFPVLLNGSRYAERLPIGLESVLIQFKPEVIRRYYHDWYRPDLQALIVVGDIDVNAMEKTIKAKFSDLKNPVHEKKRIKYTVPLTGKNQFLVVTDREVTETSAQVMFKHIAPKMRTAADYRLATITGLYNQLLGERYAELGRQGNPPFLQGSAGVQGLMGGLDTYTVSVSAKPGELERGFKAVWRENERLRRFGFTATELERAKSAFQNHMDALLKEKSKTPSESYVREYLQLFLNEACSPGITFEDKLVKEQMPGITLADVNGLSKAYIKTTDRDIIIQAPDKDKASLPAESQLLGWMKDVETEQLQPYQDAVGTAPLLSNQPVAGKVVKEETDKALNITTLTLSNGLKVVLKPTDFKNNEILFAGFAPGGTNLYSDQDFQSAANAANMVPSFGAGNYDLNQLQKFMTGKQIQVAPFISDRTQGFQGAAVPADLETALQLLYAQFTEPRKDTAMFHGIIIQSKAALSNRGNDPASVFQDSVSAVLGNHNMRRTGPTLQKLDQVNLDRAYAIYKERFSDAANFTFVFVGSFDVQTIKPQLEKYLGALPATNSHELAKDLDIHIPPGQITKEVYKGTENKATVRLVFSGPFDYSYDNAVQLDALKETLEFRLLERLREDESEVYTPSAQATCVKFPKGRYAFVIAFGCAPKNVDKLVASTLDEIKKLKTDGPPQLNIDKYKTEQKRQWETTVQTNGYWLQYLNSQLQNKSPLNEMDRFNTVMDEVTVNSVKDAANKYLSGDNFIRLVLLPEQGASK